jgi:histidinol phosphatase-like PHP family hydrolase
VKDEVIINHASAYLDLHTHSMDGSPDAGATVEGYLRWITRLRVDGDRIDGFVLTEHRKLDLQHDYSALAEQYQVTVLRGMEIETDGGHVLVYGTSERFFKEIDISIVSLPYEDVFQAALEHGGIAVGAHAGRPRIGLADHVENRGASLDRVDLIESLNGGSDATENGRALRLAEEHNLATIGGSDSHYVTGLGSCLTAFEEPVNNIPALVEQLRAGNVHAVSREEMRSAEQHHDSRH